MLVGEAGFEPTTPGLEGRCSEHVRLVLQARSTQR